MTNMQKSDWMGFERLDFELFDTSAIVVKPPKAKQGNPFVFRAEFFGAFPYADIMLCEQGYHIVYIDAHDQYGCDKAVDLMHRFHAFLADEFHLSQKAVVFGFSRGGLYAVNYAAKYPQNVSVLYLDAPVLNILSWPGGLGAGDGAPNCWKECLETYALTQGEALSFRENPIDKVRQIAQSNIPVISVVGCADTVVPYEENMKIFAKRLTQCGATVKVIEKPDCGHHPHSLENPQEICDFILKYDV